METAGNLKYPAIPVHIDTVTADKLNVFKDSITGSGMLRIAKNGTLVPMNSATHVSVTLPHKGVPKIIVLKPNPVAPCEMCDYEFGIQVQLKRKSPGVDNDEKAPDFYHFYDKIKGLQTLVNGDLAAADQASMITKIVAKMGADPMFLKYNEVGTVYKVTAQDNTGAITINGTEIDTDNPATMQKDLLDEESNAKLIPLNTGGTSWTYYILLPYGETLETELETVVIHGMYIQSKTFDFKPDVLFDQDNYVREEFSYMYVGPIAADLNYRVVVGGEKTDLVDDGNAGLATEIADIGTNVHAQGVDTKCTIAYVADDSLAAYPLSNANDSAVVNVASKEMQWPQLTADDVFKVFAHNKNLGELTQLVRNDQPLNVPYVKIVIVHKGHTQAGLHGASHVGNAEQRVSIYMPHSEFIKDVYANITLPTATGGIGAGSAYSFAELLEKTCSPTGSSGWDVSLEGSWDDFV